MAELRVGLCAVLVAAVVLAATPSRAPELAINDLDGKPLRLSHYRGQWVVLDFWASWCGPCRDELPKLVALQRRHAGHGVQVIGISLDDEVAPARKLARELRVNYPVALGDAKLAEQYGGILGLPVLFLIDPDGRIVARDEGEQGFAQLERELEARIRDGGR